MNAVEKALFTAAYQPPALMKNAHLQAFLSSVFLRRILLYWRGKYNLDRARTVLLDCGGGVRLQGFYSTPSDLRYRYQRTHAKLRERQNASTDLVVLLHGWEGSSRSTYMISLTQALLQAGYSVFRLNFRDHGDTHHLNIKHFNSTLVEEVVGALKSIQTHFSHRQYALVGFSLGGNFALRAALHAASLPQPLAHVFTVCPVINPVTAMRSISAAPAIYERYFVKKWAKSLMKKARLFSQYRYQKSLGKMRTLDEMNRFFIPRFTPYPDLDEYFAAYSIDGQKLAGLRTPSTILLSEDDPIIPFSDLQKIARPPCLNVITTRHGSHCAFLDSWALTSWVDKAVIDTLENL